MALPLIADFDDRRTCAQCVHGERPGACRAVALGKIVASRTYEPNRKELRRCEAYQPGAQDPDKRTGLQRWPGLTTTQPKKGRK
jgi:hypothetical protein